MKLKAFTILELLVAIFISGMVISAAYSVFIFSNKQIYKFTSIKANIRDYFEISSTLKRDFESAQKVLQVNEQELEMHLSDKTISYRFETNYITRHINMQTDTFHFSTTIIELNTLMYNLNENLVDYIKLDINNNAISFYKDYGAIAKLEE